MAPNTNIKTLVIEFDQGKYEEYNWKEPHSNSIAQIHILPLGLVNHQSSLCNMSTKMSLCHLTTSSKSKTGALDKRYNGTTMDHSSDRKAMICSQIYKSSQRNPDDVMDAFDLRNHLEYLHHPKCT